jgi:hypothetical protein
MTRKTIETPDAAPQVAPFPQGPDTSETVSGGPEDLMVQDSGGTLPLKPEEVPHYYEPGGIETVGAPAPLAEKLARQSAGSGSQSLGWLSIGLGLAELLFPGGVTRMGGVSGSPWLVRLYGARELATGLGLVNAREPGPWLWARAAGDVLDLLSVARGRRSGRLRHLAMLVSLGLIARRDIKAALAAATPMPQSASPGLADERPG